MIVHRRPFAGLSRRLIVGALVLPLLLGLAGCLKVKPAAARTAAAAKRTPTRQAAPPPAPEAPPPEKAAIPEEVKVLARKRRDELIAQAQKFDRRPLTRQLVREKYGVDLETLFPDGIYDLSRLKSDSEVKALAFRYAFTLADQEYSPALRQRVEAQAAKNIPLYQTGDLVETVSTNRDLVIKGRLEFVGAEYLVVGGHKILVSDLKTPSPDHFDPTLVAQRRAQYVRTNFDSPRAELLRQQQRDLTPGVYRDCGFVRVNGKGPLVSLKTLIQKEIDPLVDQEEADYNQRLRKRLEQVVIREFRRAGRLGAKPDAAAAADPGTAATN